MAGTCGSKVTQFARRWAAEAPSAHLPRPPASVQGLSEETQDEDGSLRSERACRLDGRLCPESGGFKLTPMNLNHFITKLRDVSGLIPPVRSFYIRPPAEDSTPR